MDHEFELERAYALRQQERVGEAGKERLAVEERRRRRLAHDTAAKHKHHLCHLVETKQMAAVQGMIGDAAHICGVCGRVAARAENLCAPLVRLPAK